MDFFRTISSSLLFEILSFFSPQDLWKVAAASKALSNLSKISEETAWKVICLRRWNLFSHGAPIQKYKDVYRTFLLKRRMPYGKFSSFQCSFGYGKTTQLCAWLLINHRSSGLLKHNSKNVSNAELRICVQNISCFARSLSIEEKDFIKIHLISCEEVEDGILSCHYIKLIAKNGKTSELNKGLLSLRPYEFAVLGLGVLCPKSIENEPDLLSAIEKLQIKVSDQIHEPPLIIYRDDEDKIWASYEALPRGHFLLKSNHA